MTNQVWEYTVINLGVVDGSDPQRSLSTEKILNDWGLQGWELVSVAVDPDSRSFAYFKRQKSLSEGEINA